MLTLRTSRVSTVKAVFCLTLALVALYGFALRPAYDWAASLAHESSAAPSAVATTKS